MIIILILIIIIIIMIMIMIIITLIIIIIIPLSFLWEACRPEHAARKQVPRDLTAIVDVCCSIHIHRWGNGSVACLVIVHRRG